MPMAISGPILPYQKTYKDQLIEAFINAAPQFLMTAATGGFSGSFPNPSYGAPQAGAPQLNPGVQLNQAQPQQQGMMSPPQNTQAMMKQFTSPAPQPIFPTNKRTLTLEDIKAAQAMDELNPNSIANQYKKAQTASLTPEFQANLIRIANGLTPNQGDQQDQSSSVFVESLKKLAPLADDSNPDPVSRQKARERINLFRQLSEAPL